MILVLVGISYFKWSNFELPESTLFSSFEEESEKKSFSFEEIIYDSEESPLERREGAEMIPTKNREEIESKEYTERTVEETLKISHPKAWTFKKINESLENNRIHFLFVSQSKELDYPPSLAVLRINESNPQKAKEMTKKGTERGGLTMEYTKKEKKEDGVILLETRNQQEDLTSISKKKMIPFEEEYYVVSVTSFKEQTALYEPVMERILSSVKIKEE